MDLCEVHFPDDFHVVLPQGLEPFEWDLHPGPGVAFD